MATKTRKLELAEMFDTPESQAALLADALAEGDANYIAVALGVIARARGMTELARAADLPRQTLYRALAEGGNPTLDTTMRILKALGWKLTPEPIGKTTKAAA